MSEDTRPRIAAYLEQLSGTSAERVPDSLIEHALHLLMGLWGCATEEELIRLAESTPEIRSQLIQKTTIKETYFFREPDFIHLAAGEIYLEMSARRRPVRILCAGCSTGAEAYSISAALVEQYGMAASGGWRIIGVDIDPLALAAAREGTYTAHALRGMDRQLISRRFEQKISGLYTIRPEYRRSVEFRQVNLVDERQVASLEAADIIFYRNVSIYFSDQLRPKVFRSLARLLAPDGVLITGSAETIPHNIGILPLIELRGKFLFAKKKPAGIVTSPAIPIRRTPVKKPRATAPPRVKNPAPAKRADPPSIETVIHIAREGLLDEASELIAQIRRAGGTDERIDTLEAAVRLERGELAEAAECARRSAVRDPIQLEPHILLALIYRLEKRPDEALRELKKALFIDESCWAALYYTGELYRETGELKLAERHYQRAVEAISTNRKKEYLMIHNITEESSRQLIRLCGFGIQKIRELQNASSRL